MLHLLLLGGCAEARKLADEIYQKFSQNIAIIYSLAGITENPTLPKHIEKFTYHRHGFGGYQGFVNFLETREVDIIINATHPFTTKINETAAKASVQKNIAYARYIRPAWDKNDFAATDTLPAANWIEIDNDAKIHQWLKKNEAVNKAGANIFLNLGKKSLIEFFADKNCAQNSNHHYITRTIAPFEDEPALAEIMRNHRFKSILATPPFCETTESEFFQANKITCLICQNSGGKSGAVKLRIAQKLHIPIIMKARPNAPQTVKYQFETADNCLLWLETQLQTKL